jgi:Uma2 family endonuclease
MFDGELVERHVGECDHSYLQTLIIGELASREPGRKFHVFIALRLRVRERTYRIPDICVISLPYRRQPIPTEPPHLVIEIVSREDETADILAKVADYLRFGIPHIWIPNPYKRTLQEADRDGIRDCPSLLVETELVGRVDFNELFARLDQPTE